MTTLGIDQALATLELRAGPLPVADRDAFAHAMRSHQHRIAHLVGRLLGWPAAATEVDDVVQEVFLAAWQHRRQFRGDGAFGAWLARIAVHRTRNHVRARGRRQQLLGLFGLGPGVEPAAPEPTDGDGRVRSALARLPHRDREVLVLRYLEHQSVAALAAELRVRAGAVEQRLSRARRRLRQLLEEEEQ